MINCCTHLRAGVSACSVCCNSVTLIFSFIIKVTNNNTNNNNDTQFGIRDSFGLFVKSAIVLRGRRRLLGDLCSDAVML